MKHQSLPETPSKKRVVSKIHTRFPKISLTQESNLLFQLKKVINVFKKVATEPQLQIAVREKKIEGEKTLQKRHDYSLEIVEYLGVHDQDVNSKRS